MKYVFLDVEWNQIQNRFDLSEDEIFEIGAVGAEESFQETKDFFHIVKLEKLELVSNEILKILHLQRRTLKEAKPITEILEKLKCTYQQIEILVVWNRYGYEIFQNACKEYGVKVPVERVLVLQEMLSVIDSTTNGNLVSIKKMFRRYNISVEERLLHIAKYDTVYLKKLYCTVKFQYMQLCGTKHGSFTAIPKTLWSRELKKEESFEENVSRICDRYHMTCKFVDGMFAVGTGIGKWGVFHDGKNVISVYHENYRGNYGQRKKKKKKYNEEFHKQNVDTADMEEVLEYIYYHDKNFFSGKKFNSKLEYLLDKVEKELKA